MRHLFDADWDDLDVPSVERFLADAGDEGLIWEAKGGGKQPHPDSVRKAVSGFANSVGGYLIIGADRDGDNWRLPGVRFSHPEPATWLSSVIADGGVSPVPLFDPKPLALSDGKAAMVVAVEPVAQPPCITSSGVVYQRVSGQTLPVTDQRVLSDLIQRGEAVRLRTEANALRAARRLLTDPGVLGAGAGVAAIGLCAVEGPEDRSSILFQREFNQTLGALAAEVIQANAPDGYVVQSQIRQDCLRVVSGSAEAPISTTAAAFWDGAAAISIATTEEPPIVPLITHNVRRSWPVLVEIVRAMGGLGNAHLAIAFNTNHPAMQRAGAALPETDVRRWSEIRAPTPEELDSVDREIERGFGRPHWEP